MNDQPPVQVEFEKLQMLFDIAVGSLNFGSGMLDTDEVNLLRDIAVKLGVDPMEGTPSGFAKYYRHPHKQGRHPLYPGCIYCDQFPDNPIHGTEPTAP